MPKVTVVCYIASLMFYGFAYSRNLMFNPGQIYTFDDSFNLYLATIYYVLAIVSAVIGSLVFYLSTLRVESPFEAQEAMDLGHSYKYKRARERVSGERARSKIKAQSVQYNHGMDWERRISS
ncbi:hypothetical protein ACPUYX_11965 [Desulfosporosinus sp. SYSU MS00001]|uniref:hypothetical protein n=1 Tax=Desulfosporosinus sp. SYSU MS00001 TaxID=3416284 RepID=UPI003CF9113E